MQMLMKLSVFLGSMILASAVLSHEGHEHAQQLDQAKAVETAAAKIVELIDEGLLSSSWATKPPSGAQLARVNGLQNWVVSYLDDSARERLELIFTMTGEFVSMAKTPISDSVAAQ